MLRIQDAFLTIICALAVLIAPVSGASIVHADTRVLVDAETQSQIDTAYAEMMQDPTNRSLNLRYSTMMAKVGDYEAAVPPLERILIHEPDNAWLMLQLGILYKHLNSEAIARSYLQQAATSPNASDDVVAKANNLLSYL